MPKEKTDSDAYEIALKELKLEYEDAEKYYEKATKLRPNNFFYLSDYAKILSTLGKYEKAIEYYQKSLESAIDIFGDNHREVASRFHDLGLGWRELGEHQKSMEYLEKAYSIFFQK